MTFLQDHVSFTFMLFIPIYWIFGWLTGTYTLLFIQNVFILLGGLFLYKLIELKTSEKLLSILALIQYLVIYGRWTMFGADCNLAIIASSMIPVFIYFFEKRSFFLMSLTLLFVLITREDMALWTFFIGIFLLIKHLKEKEYRRASLFTIIISIAYFILVFSLIIPSLETEHKKFSLFNYTALGKNPVEALVFIIQNPIETLKLLFINNSGNPLYDNVKLEFYYVYFICGGFLLLFRPLYLILFIPILAKKMLNNEPLRWSTDTYYSIEFVSILPIAVFLIIFEIKTKLLKSFLIIIVCTGTIYITINKLKGHDNRSVFWSDYKHAFYKKDFYKPRFNVNKVYQHFKEIPPNASISATGTLVPHLAWRPTIYPFPKVADANYIMVLTDGDTYPLNQSQFDSTLYFYLNNDNWRIMVDDFPLMIIKKEKNEVNSPYVKPVKIMEYVCDAETLNYEKSAFISSSGLNFYNTENQTNVTMHRGNYSIRLTPESPFGMTTIISHVEAGERFEITVWRKADNNEGKIIACSTIKNSYYNSESVVIQRDEKGWEQIRKRLFINQSWPNRELKVYLWNIGQDTVYFDDLHIVRESQ
jgi:uncharacterized membrane protein